MSPRCQNCDEYVSHDYVRVLAAGNSVEQCWRCDTKQETAINEEPEEPFEVEEEDG